MNEIKEDLSTDKEALSSLEARIATLEEDTVPAVKRIAKTRKVINKRLKKPKQRSGFRFLMVKCRNLSSGRVIW